MSSSYDAGFGSGFSVGSFVTLLALMLIGILMGGFLDLTFTIHDGKCWTETTYERSNFETKDVKSVTFCKE